MPSSAPSSEPLSASVDSLARQARVRLVAMYLPQFHPIAENDAWWGRGFTEWTNVTRARPLFPGHQQPHLPADLGFYDLRLPEAREAQAALAREYGIAAFCYYHYWFGGKRLLERPFEEVLASGRPDFPFCLCWANENWTRRWDGLEREVLMAQRYSAEDDLAHIRSLLPAFADRRYLRIDGRPVFLVYRTALLPDPRRTAECWRDELVRAGLSEPYLVRVGGWSDAIDPRSIGFDAAMGFSPDWSALPPRLRASPLRRAFARLGLGTDRAALQRIMAYDDLVERALATPPPGYPQYPCVTPMWDNSARRQRHAAIFVGSTPQAYRRWLERTLERFVPPSPQENLVFVNAWNEWAEGNHLEPCQRWERAYLEATREALTAQRR